MKASVLDSPAAVYPDESGRRPPAARSHRSCLESLFAAESLGGGTGPAHPPSPEHRPAPPPRGRTDRRDDGHHRGAAPVAPRLLLGYMAPPSHGGGIAKGAQSCICNATSVRFVAGKKDHVNCRVLKEPAMAFCSTPTVSKRRSGGFSCYADKADPPVDAYVLPVRGSAAIDKHTKRFLSAAAVN